MRYADPTGLLFSGRGRQQELGYGPVRSKVSVRCASRELLSLEISGEAGPGTQIQNSWARKGHRGRKERAKNALDALEHIHVLSKEPAIATEEDEPEEGRNWEHGSGISGARCLPPAASPRWALDPLPRGARVLSKSTETTQKAAGCQPQPCPAAWPWATPFAPLNPGFLIPHAENAIKLVKHLAPRSHTTNVSSPSPPYSS